MSNMKLNVKNLEKLARGLMTVPREQFNMEAFQMVFDGETFADKHPVLARREKRFYNITDVKSIRGRTLNSLDPHFIIEHNCGTAGCALGWAPALVKRGRKDESWAAYSSRVFGVETFERVWAYMFSGVWSREQNTPEATAGRIMYVVKNGHAPIGWNFRTDDVLIPEFASENA